MSGVIKKDVFGKMLEHQVNSTPFAGGAHRKVQYSPHMGQMFVEADTAGRDILLQDNRRLYLQNRCKQSAAHIPMRIPEMDWIELLRKNPHLKTCDQQEKDKFYEKLYRDHPEYRIG